MEKTIKVTGRGKLSLRPDRIRLHLDLSDTRHSYQETMNLSAARTRNLREALEPLGFEGRDLKTAYFNVDAKYENVRDRNGDWKKRFAGYEYTHRFVLEFDADQELLGRVLSALAQSQVRPELRIEYTVKHPEAAKEALLGKAVSDSAAKARVLTQAAGVVLGDLISIDYSWGEVEYSVSPIGRMSAETVLAEREDGIPEIEPEDLDLEDTVTVLWQIR